MAVSDNRRHGAAGGENGRPSPSSQGRARRNRASRLVAPYSARNLASRGSPQLNSPPAHLEETSAACLQATDRSTSLDGDRTSFETTDRLTPPSSSSGHTPPPRRSPRLASITPAPPAESPQASQVLESQEGGTHVRRSPRLLEQSPHRDAGRSSTDEESLNQLVVRPIVKKTISQRDSSGETLDDFVVNGSLFRHMLPKLWQRFSPRVKGRAVKAEEEWSLQPPEMEKWYQVMQLKSKRHVVDSGKSERAWNAWLHASRGETVLLLVFEYGIAITTNQVLATFKSDCIDRSLTDRAGATAEYCLHEVVESLQERWESVFDAPNVVWRMWANRITSNLDRSTWEAAINRDPPADILKMLRASESRLAEQLTNVSRSSSLALNCGTASLEDCRILHQEWEPFGRRLRAHENDLKTRKSVIEGFMLDVLPNRDVPDPLDEMENIPDFDHE